MATGTLYATSAWSEFGPWLLAKMVDKLARSWIELPDQGLVLCPTVFRGMSWQCGMSR